MDIYDRINFRLNEKNITRKQMANDLSISYNTINAYFKRRSKSMKLSTVKMIAEYLDVNLDWLIEGEGSQEITPSENELIQIFKELKMADKHDLLSYAYSLLEKNEKNK